jgi:hypothetical protein
MPITDSDACRSVIPVDADREAVAQQHREAVTQ